MTLELSQPLRNQICAFNKLVGFLIGRVHFFVFLFFVCFLFPLVAFKYVLEYILSELQCRLVWAVRLCFSLPSLSVKSKGLSSLCRSSSTKNIKASLVRNLKFISFHSFIPQVFGILYAVS